MQTDSTALTETVSPKDERTEAYDALLTITQRIVRSSHGKICEIVLGELDSFDTDGLFDLRRTLNGLSKAFADITAPGFIMTLTREPLPGVTDDDLGDAAMVGKLAQDFLSLRPLPTLFVQGKLRVKLGNMEDPATAGDRRHKLSRVAGRLEDITRSGFNILLDCSESKPEEKPKPAGYK